MTNALIGFLGAMIGATVVLFGHLLVLRQAKQFTAAEKRLAAHQEAFATWWRLAIDYHDPAKRGAALQTCQSFWNSNCLYLGRRSRKAFREAMVDVMFYEGWRETPQKMIEMHEKIEGVFHAILADAALPDLHESLVDIRKLLKKEEKKDA